MWKLLTTTRKVAVERETALRAAPVPAKPRKTRPAHTLAQPSRAAAKTDTVHRWHIPDGVVGHKIKPAPHGPLRAAHVHDTRPPARQAHRPDLPERVTAHPGEILKEEFLKPLGLSVNGLAAALCVPANRIGAIIKGERSVTADTALRLGRYFRTSAEFWMNLQSMHDLTRTRDVCGPIIDRAVHPRK